jgi:hypothetical protein
MASVFMPVMVVLDCGLKRQSLAYFVDKQEKHRGSRQRGERIRRVANRRLLKISYSAIASPEPPNSAGKSLNFGRPSRIGSTVSA